MDPVVAEGLKRRAAEVALTYVRSGMVLGLGTGSTVAHLLSLLGDAITSGTLTDIVAVPTSEWTAREAGLRGIELIGLGDRERLDLTIDGADEVSPGVDLIKGMGGALLREKMVAQASERFVVIADERKAVQRLGTVSPLPVEVVEWGHEVHADFLRSTGAEVSVRRTEAGTSFRTDNGNVILDCRYSDGLDDPHALEAALRARAGVVETGLFLGLANEALIASPGGVRVLRRDA
jgi:ribose 5-phosphate isomerase A